MRLQEFFQGFVPSAKQTSTLSQDGVSNNQLMDKLIRSLVPGQTLLGEILSNKDGQIELRLDSQLLLHATLEQNMNLEVGSKMTFQVKNNGKSLTLNPLFTNTATDTTTLKAIEMAGLPLNKQSVELTREFIGRGLPIHRQSLTQAYHELTQNETAQPKDIAILHKLGIEVSKQSLQQLSNYRETAYQFETASKSLVDGLVDMAEQFTAEGKPQQAQALLKDVWNMLEQQMPSESVTHLESSKLPQQAVENVEYTKGQDVSLRQNDEMIQTKSTMNSEVLKNNDVSEDASQLRLQNSYEQDMNEQISGGDISAKEIPLSQDTTEKILHIDDKIDANTLENKQTSENPVENKVNIEYTTPNQAKKETILAKDLFEVLTDKLGKEGEPPQKQEFISTVKDMLLDKWLQASGLSLKDVETKEKVTELYHRLGKLLLETEQIAEQAGGKELPGFQMVKEFQQNLNFLNQVNQFSQFIQLPLYQEGKSAHGDLYVFSSKKNLTLKDGKISAYLHLDMANLGSVGIYVAMENQKVNTQFMLESEESLKLIEDNIDALTKRLQKRGYQLSYTTQLGQTTEKKGIAPIEQEQEEVRKIQEFSFDVRA